MMKTPGVTKRIHATLRERRGEVVTVGDLIEAAWGGCEDGGPEWADNCLRHSIMALRKQGIPIRRVSGYTLD
jgi:hypothetical protein